MPFVWSRKDKDDGSDKGMGGDAGEGRDPSGCPPAQGVDGDTEMTNAPSSGAAGNNSLMSEVQSLLRGRAVTPINPKPRTFRTDRKSVV